MILLPRFDEESKRYVWDEIEVMSISDEKGNGVVTNEPLKAGTVIPIVGHATKTRPTVDTHMYRLSGRGSKYVNGHPSIEPHRWVACRGLAIALMCNQPSKGETANCVFTKNFLVVVKDVEENTELTVVYGNSDGFEVGEPPSKADVEKAWDTVSTEMKCSGVRYSSARKELQGLIDSFLEDYIVTYNTDEAAFDSDASLDDAECNGDNDDKTDSCGGGDEKACGSTNGAKFLAPTEGKSTSNNKMYTWAGLVVRQTESKGLGVFATETLFPGTVIPILGKLCDAAPPSTTHVFKRRGKEQKSYVDGSPALLPFRKVGHRGLSIAMMINEPDCNEVANCSFALSSVLVARKIKKGEELTVHYMRSSECDSRKHKYRVGKAAPVEDVVKAEDLFHAKVTARRMRKYMTKLYELVDELYKSEK